MLITTFTDKDVTIDWVHNNPIRTSPRTCLLAGTVCIISEGPKGTQTSRMDKVAEGHSVLADKDRFNKSIGRKVSLVRALKSAGYARAIRKDIWIAYLTHTKK